MSITRSGSPTRVCNNGLECNWLYIDAINADSSEKSLDTTCLKMLTTTPLGKQTKTRPCQICPLFDGHHVNDGWSG